VLSAAPSLDVSKHTVAKLLPSSSPPMNRAIAELVSPVISGAVPYDATSALDVGTCSGHMTKL